MNGPLVDSIMKTVLEPRAGARIVLGWQLNWNAILLISLIAVVIALLQLSIVGISADETSQNAGIAMPTTVSLNSVIYILGQFVGSVLVIFFIGRLFGGKGSLQDTAMVVGWTGFVQGALILVPTILTLVQPAMGGLLLLIVLVWSIWIVFCFIAEMHGFASVWKVCGVSFGLALLLAVVLVFAGFSPDIVGEIPNAEG